MYISCVVPWTCALSGFESLVCLLHWRDSNEKMDLIFLYRTETLSQFTGLSGWVCDNLHRSVNKKWLTRISCLSPFLCYILHTHYTHFNKIIICMGIIVSYFFHVWEKKPKHCRYNFYNQLIMKFWFKSNHFKMKEQNHKVKERVYSGIVKYD